MDNHWNILETAVRWSATRNSCVSNWRIQALSLFRRSDNSGPEQRSSFRSSMISDFSHILFS